MALLAPLFAFVGRQVGRLVQMVFGWATVMLFGRVPQSKQLLLAAVALGSLAWVVAVIGVIVPSVGTFLLAAIPRPEFIAEGWVRLAMLVLAVVLPLGVGTAGLMLMDPDDRPTEMRGKAIQVLRGYPYAAVLSLVILFLAIVAPVFKVRAIVKRWEDAHIPIVIKPGGYDQVAGELEAAVDAAGLDLARVAAPRVLEMPSRLLALVGGESVRRLVPDRLVMLKAPALEVTIHPSDVAVVGSKEAVARARAAVAARLTRTEAYLTSSREAQEVEDAIRALQDARSAGDVRQTLAAVDERLARLVVPYEEWEVLYRQRLQTERDLLREALPATGGEGRNGDREPRRGLVGRVVRAIGDAVR